MADIYRNAEGYYDPAAGAALRSMTEEEAKAHYAAYDEADRRATLLIKAIKNLIILSDFTLEERIHIKDNKTGRIYK